VKACVFVGPTLRPGDRGATGDIAILPPVAQGDVHRVAQSRPRAIGIIDGYFEGVLSVWHKEILWAMAEGIHVFGSASMGALRAAELHAFGMQGIGRIFEAYRAGELEDDDEVAVIHGPAETGYLALSEAMVNIRRTLAEAERAGVIGAPSREALIRLAKELFYHDRTFERLLDRAAGSPGEPDEIAALRAWLPAGRIDQKRDDALAMLAAMQALLASEPEPFRADYVFEWTEVWDSATSASAGSQGTGAGGPAAWLPDDRVLEELRLEAATYLSVRDQALLRFLAGREAGRRRQRVDPTAAREVFARLRTRCGLFTRADLDRWLEANRLEPERLDRLLEAQAQLEATGARAESALRGALLDELRLRNDFARLAERARAKQEVLESRGLDHPRADDAPLAPPTLRAWYFEQRLGRPLPDDIDAAARQLGFEDRADLDRALRREWLHSREGRADGRGSCTGDRLAPAERDLPRRRPV
jgi:hypothetical protein